MAGKVRRRSTGTVTSRSLCPACGGKIAAAHKFCPHCGTSLTPLAGSLKVIPLTDGCDVSEALRGFVPGRVGARPGGIDDRLNTERRPGPPMFPGHPGFPPLA